MPMEKLFWISDIPAIMHTRISSPWEGDFYNIN